MKEKFDADVFRKYIRSMPFLKIEDENVICVDRSQYFQRIRDHNLVDIAQELNRHLLDSTEIHRGLISRGISTNAIGGLMTNSPLIVNLKKGHYRTKGQYRLICKIEDLDLVYEEDNAITGDFPTDDQLKFQIENNPPLRTTGRAIVPGMAICGGENNVFDENDNLVDRLRVTGEMMLGLKGLADRSNGKNIMLSFCDGHFTVG